MHDATALVFHFHLLLGVAGIEKSIDLGNDIEGDLVREDFLLDRLVVGDGLGLVAEFVDGAGSCSRDSLVGRSEDSLHAKSSVQWMQGHEGDRGRAIRVGNDAAVVFHILAVDFGNDEWHLGHHPKSRGIIDHDRAAIHGGFGVVARNSAAGAEKGDVDVAEGVERERFNGVSFATKFEGFTRRAGRGEEAEACDGKVAALHDAEHFHSDRSGRADDCDSIRFRHNREL